MNHNNQQPGSADLLPCPFCGGREAGICERDNLHFVMCDNCTAEGPAMEGVESRLNAAAEWNRRASSAVEQSAEKVGREWIERAWFECNQDIFAFADAIAASCRTAGEAPVAYLATDLDGRGDVAFTKEEAMRRAGEGCDHFISLFDAAPVSAGQADPMQGQMIVPIDWRKIVGELESGGFQGNTIFTARRAAEIISYLCDPEKEKLFAQSAGQAVQVATLPKPEARASDGQYSAFSAFQMDARYREGYSAGWNEGRADLAAPVSPPDGAMPEYFEPVEIPADLTEGQYWRRRAFASHVMAKSYKAKLESALTAQPAEGMRPMPRLDQFATLDEYKKAMDAYDADMRAKPAEGITLPEALAAISRFAKADHPYSSATLTERREARAQFDAIAARIGAIDPAEGSAQVAQPFNDQTFRTMVATWAHNFPDWSTDDAVAVKRDAYWRSILEYISKHQRMAAPERSDTPAARELYECIGKGGKYELLGTAKGAGVDRFGFCKVYRDTQDGQLYFRNEVDFRKRMARIDGDKQGAQGDA